MFLPIRSVKNLDSIFGQTSYVSGLEYEFPAILPVPMAALIMFLLLMLGKGKSGPLISLILSSLTGVYLLFVLLIINFSLFETPETGIGYYGLALGTLGFFVLSIIQIVKPNQVQKPNDVNVLDGF